MRTRALTVMAITVLLAAVPAEASSAPATSATLYAYAGATGSTAGCPISATVSARCSLSAALTQAKAGDIVALASTDTPYVGNWSITTSGTSMTAPVTLEPAPGSTSMPVLSGNSGVADGCTTASCRGSILTVGGGVSLVVHHVELDDGRNYTGNGGAIDVGDHTTGSTLTVTNSVFTDDASELDVGGAIAASNGGSANVSVSGSTFTRNFSQGGAAISSGYRAGGGSLHIESSVFDSNDSNGSGGGVQHFTGGGGAFTVRDSTFIGNGASTGGAIDIEDDGSGSSVISNSTFTGNSAFRGGAVEITPYGSGPVAVLGSTFSRDTVYRSSPVQGNELDVQDTTEDDVAGDDTGIGAIVEAGNLIAGPCTMTAAVLTDDGHNATVDASCVAKGVGDVVSATVGTLAAPAHNRSATTPTIALTTANPAFARLPNGATAAHAPAAYRTLCPRTDQTGYRTPTGAGCDAGAIDLSAPTRPTLTFTADHSIARGATHTLAGRARPGVAVALDLGATTLARTTASRTGTFSFARTFTSSGSYTAVADGGRSATLTLTVIALTLNPASGPLKKGTHTLTGHAPAGRSVTLLRDGHTVARTTATAKNGYAFKVLIDATHRFQVSCDGITTTPTIIRITK